MAKEDTPNYMRAASPGTSCATCEAFQLGWCTEYDFAADPAWTCDSWWKRVSKEPITVPAQIPGPTTTSAYPTTSKEWNVPGGMLVFKDKNNAYRWVLYSTDAFEDRDGEVVSLKALEDDVARTDASGEYGPLRWWHVGNPVWGSPTDWRSVRAGPGLDIGQCDFSAIHGKVLIESGTFSSPELGAAIAAKSNDYQASLGFSHPLEEPASDGVYHNINRFERSLTPRHKASNPRTGILVAKEATLVDPIKLETFKEAVGEELAAQVLQQAGVQEKEARAAGIREKESDPTLVDLQAQMDDLTAQLAAFKARAAAVTNGESDTHPPVQEDGAIAMEEKADVEPDGDESEMIEEDGMGEDDIYVGDMTSSEFTQLLATALGEVLGQHLGPISKSLDLHGQMTKTLGEMKSYLGGLAQKDSTVAELREQLQTLQLQFKEAVEQLEELQGVQPRALQSPQIARKSSEAATNIITEQHPLYQSEDAQPVRSPLGWIDSMFYGQQAGQ